MPSNVLNSASNPQLDNTVRIFDNFYKYEQQVNPEEYDVVFGYFKDVMTTDQAANNFTTALFRVASTSNQNVLTLLNEIKTIGTQNTLTLSAAVAYYLNASRSKSSLLGVNSPLATNKFVARNLFA